MSKLPRDPNPGEVPSTSVGVIGLIITIVCLILFFFFVWLSGIVPSQQYESTLVLWTWLGSNAIMGMWLVGGGKFMSRPVRMAYLIATVLSLLCTILPFVGSSTSFNSDSISTAFYTIILPAITSLTQQLIGWRR